MRAQLLLDHVVAIGALDRQRAIEPCESRSDACILIAQPMIQLNRERGTQLAAFEAAKNGQDGLGLLSRHAQQTISQEVGVDPRLTVARKPLGDAPQILHQRDAQRDRDGPQLADVERLHALVGVHEARQHVSVEPAVGVRDKGPRDAEDTRIALQMAVGELGQLPIVRGRQIFLDLAYLFLDDVEIVEQPLGSR